MDVHKKSWTVHFKTDLFDNKTVTMPTDPLALICYVDANFENHLVHSRKPNVVRSAFQLRFLYSIGVCPVFCLKSLLKYCGYSKPKE